jgi:hypothetical protein
MNLSAFLNPVQIENDHVEVSKRFIDPDTKEPVKWEIRPIMSEESDKIVKKYTKREKKTQVEIFDRQGYMNELVTSAVVNPDLKNEQLQKHYGVLGEISLLNKMLTLGEFAVLSAAVQSLSGLLVEDNEEIEKAKN